MATMQKDIHPTVEFEFTEEDFHVIARIAMENFGLSLPVTKHLMVYSRISRRLRALGLQNFASYRDMLTGPAAKKEQLELLSVLTTNVTSFFRENHHFEFLKKRILPVLIEKARAGGRVRIWSAGCSTGQEPYSIALTILDTCPDAASMDIKVLATDIDPKIIKQAEAAQFKSRDVESIPSKLLDQFFQRRDDPKYDLLATPPLTSLVSFGVLNLIEEFPVKGPFDVIFCRNVAIYFDKVTQEAVWNKVVSKLDTNGHLFIGHSERLSGPAASKLRSGYYFVCESFQIIMQRGLK